MGDQAFVCRHSPLSVERRDRVGFAPGLPAVAGLPAIVQSAKRCRFARLQANKKKKTKTQPPLHSFGSSAVGQNDVVLADCRRLQSKIDWAIRSRGVLCFFLVSCALDACMVIIAHADMQISVLICRIILSRYDKLN